MASSVIVPGSLFLVLRAVRVLLTSSGTVPHQCYPDASAPIHPSSWKANSPKSGCKIPHGLAPVGPQVAGTGSEECFRRRNMLWRR
jgi:hypothetical protein